MGFFDCYCTLCGAPINGINIIHEMNLTNKLPNINWLKKFYILFDNNFISEPMEDPSGSVFNVIYSKSKSPSGYYLSMSYDNLFRSKVCLCIHCDCYKFIKREYGISLKFSHFPFHISGKRNYNYFAIKPEFYDIHKYWFQSFRYKNIIHDKKEFLLDSPLRNIKKANSLLKTFNKYKIRTNLRNSPLSSASWYKSGDIKIGEDDNFYKVKNGKWIKINYKLVEMKCILYDFYKKGKKVNIDKVRNPKLYYKIYSKCYKNLLVRQIGYLTRDYLVKKIKNRQRNISAILYKFSLD